MEKCGLMIGEIVQLSPENNGIFGAHFMVVTEIKEWGAQGYCSTFPDPEAAEKGELGGLAYFRATWDRMERTGGMAQWMPKNEKMEGENKDE